MRKRTVIIGIIMAIALSGCSRNTPIIEEEPNVHTDDGFNKTDYTSNVDHSTEPSVEVEEYREMNSEYGKELYDSYDAISEESQDTFEDGKSTDEMLFEQYGKVSDDSTEINDAIDIPLVQDVEDSSIYELVKKEVSAIASTNEYQNIEVNIEEWNVNTHNLSYIIRFDNSTFYFVEVNTDTKMLMSRSDTYGSGEEIWEEITNNQGE